MRIVTNNPKVNKEIKGQKIYFIDGDYGDVLEATKEMIIDERQVLLSHPLSGSIKPNETFYKSIFLHNQKSEYVDLYSLELIESAQATYNKFVEDRPTPKWTEEILEDFQLVDYHLVEATLTRIQIPPNYL